MDILDNAGCTMLLAQRSGSWATPISVRFFWEAVMRPGEIRGVTSKHCLRGLDLPQPFGASDQTPQTASETLRSAPQFGVSYWLLAPSPAQGINSPFCERDLGLSTP